MPYLLSFHVLSLHNYQSDIKIHMEKSGHWNRQSNLKEKSNPAQMQFLLSELTPKLQPMSQERVIRAGIHIDGIGFNDRENLL